MKADRNVKKFGDRHILRRIYGEQNSVANSARRNFSGGFSADKIRRRFRRSAAAEGSTPGRVDPDVVDVVSYRL